MVPRIMLGIAAGLAGRIRRAVGDDPLGRQLAPPVAIVDISGAAGTATPFAAYRPDSDHDVIVLPISALWALAGMQPSESKGVASFFAFLSFHAIVQDHFHVAGGQLLHNRKKLINAWKGCTPIIAVPGGSKTERRGEGTVTTGSMKLMSINPSKETRAKLRL